MVSDHRWSESVGVVGMDAETGVSNGGMCGEAVLLYRKSRVKYSANDLMVFRYKYRGMQLTKKTTEALKIEGLFVYFNPRRGVRGGVRASARHINVITSRVVLGERILKRNAINCGNLVRISTSNIMYQFPKIFYTNLRSVYSKFDDLQAYMLDINPDVAVLSESWVKKNDVDAFEVNGFRSVHRIRDRKDKLSGGGVLLYFKNDMTIFSIDYPEMNEIEAVTVSFRSKYLPRITPWMAIIAVYNPPAFSLSCKVREFISGEVDRLLQINSLASIFIMGDFNELDIFPLISPLGFAWIRDAPTRGLLSPDKFYYRGSCEYRLVIEAPLASSDHNICILNANNCRENVNHNVEVATRPKRKSCSDSFGRAIASYDWSNFFLIDELDMAVDHFNEVIVSLYEICFPVVRKWKKTNDCVWFTDKIRSLIGKKNVLFKAGDRLAMSEISSVIKEEIFLAKRRDAGRRWSSIKRGSVSYFQFLRANVKSKNGEFQNFPGLSIEDSAIDIRNFYQSLASVYPPVDGELIKSLQVGSQIDLASHDWVLKQLLAIRVSSAPGPDDIPNFVLKDFAYELFLPIAHLINFSLERLEVPSAWKRGFTVPVPKVRVPTKPGDLRPISLLSVISKICERHILGIILPKVSELIDCDQYGAVPGHSTDHYLVKYVDAVLKPLERPGMSAVSVITDFNKAYDFLDHRLCIKALQEMGVGHGVVRWVASFLSNRRQILKMKNCPNRLDYSINNGVPQGSVLGGILFVVTTNRIIIDAPSKFKFIDDMTVVCVDKVEAVQDRVREIVGLIEKDSKECGMSVNPSKTCLMVHNFSRKSLKVDVGINGVETMVVGNCKILGVVFQNNLKWDLNVEYITGKAYKRFFMLYRLKRMGLPLDVLIHVYLTFIRPCLEYSSVVWSGALTAGHISMIEQVQKRALRIVYGGWNSDYQFLLGIFGLVSLEERRQQLFDKFVPKFLGVFKEFCPAKRSGLYEYETRNCRGYMNSYYRTKRYATSSIPLMVKSLNRCLALPNV